MNQDFLNLESTTSSQWIDQLYHEHGRFIESIIRFAATESQEREDIYQEVFMALLRIRNPGEIKDIRDYLYILTLNKVNEYKRKESRSRQIMKQYVDILSQGATAERHDSVVVREEAARMLNLVESRLSKKEAEAVLLRYRDKTDADEAAKKMNITKKSFTRYVSIGVKKVRAIVRSLEKTD